MRKVYTTSVHFPKRT